MPSVVHFLVDHHPSSGFSKKTVLSLLKLIYFKEFQIKISFLLFLLRAKCRPIGRGGMEIAFIG